jgi:membrane protein CcdC involved in cytochrome C biogenesis
MFYDWNDLVECGGRKMKTGSKLAIILFVLVAIAHLVRLITATEITVGGNVAPLWVSAVGVIVPVAVAYLLWKESRSS